MKKLNITTHPLIQLVFLQIKTNNKYSVSPITKSTNILWKKNQRNEIVASKPEKSCFMYQQIRVHDIVSFFLQNLKVQVKFEHHVLLLCQCNEMLKIHLYIGHYRTLLHFISNCKYIIISILHLIFLNIVKQTLSTYTHCLICI